MGQAPATLLIACGALAWEITEVIRRNGWIHMAVQCLPAHWHNTPARLPEAVRAKIRENRDRFERIVVLYGDCGTGGLLDRVIEEEGVERIDGPHCYQFYAGADAFAALHDAEPGTFYLTDYLARHFDRLIIAGLGLDRLLDFVLASGAEGMAKPDPDFFRLAAARAGVPTAEALMVGDSYRADVEGAQTAGMAGILLRRREWRDRREAVPAGAVVIASLAELPGIVLGVR